MAPAGPHSGFSGMAIFKSASKCPVATCTHIYYIILTTISLVTTKPHLTSVEAPWLSLHIIMIWHVGCMGNVYYIQYSLHSPTLSCSQKTVQSILYD